jgi:hypothetical protein
MSEQPDPACRAGTRSCYWCRRFAVSAADFFGLPANRTVELGSRIEI